MKMTTKVRRRAIATLAAGTFGLGAIATMAPASAGEVWPGEVEIFAACIEGDGVVLVDIFDDFSANYDVGLYLGDDLVDLVENITDTDEGEETVVFGPLDDGTYTVIVDWVLDQSEEGFLMVFEGDVTVDCDADVTTTTSAVAPSSTTPPPAAAAAAATPRFTG